MESKAPTTDPARALRTLRIIYGAILVGILVFAAVAPLVRIMMASTPGVGPRSAPRPGISREVSSILVYSWIAVTIGLSVAGYVLAHSLLKSRSSTATETGEAPPSLQKIMSQVALAGLLTDAAALYGIVVYILVGYLPILATAVAAGVLGLALSFPRAELFTVPPAERTDAVTYH
jgi:hypothetical protein